MKLYEIEKAASDYKVLLNQYGALLRAKELGQWVLKSKTFWRADIGVEDYVVLPISKNIVNSVADREIESMRLDLQRRAKELGIECEV